ncbi:hypothetical protein QQS21_012311 [Conoideocrella luteorostrata]|uniref:Zn(2)-C6 fungal-type domain-containing protein n=1 Tax=Conoideocrella luteorostrata TaxID=1105319 RepID=A0AAJ0CDS5_9HYPO|nr:hypothetical protein QQS21_012311 [Conoideocrella luteorostrata]
MPVCDEKIPCGACVRHAVECSLTTSASRADEAAVDSRRSGGIPAHNNAPRPHRRRHRELKPAQLPQTPSVTTDPASSAATSNRQIDDDPFPYLNSLFSSAGSPDSLTWVDLELMHHFTATTWQTLPKGYQRQEVWQIAVPKLALEYDFVMHQVLAISAYHLAHLSPVRQTALVIRASQHQNLAIRGLRTVLPVISDTNCHAAFAVASLLSIGAFSSSSGKLAQPGQPNVDMLLEVFLLIRGMHHILKEYEHVIAEGPIGKILQQTNRSGVESAQLRNVVHELESVAMDCSRGGNAEGETRVAALILVKWIKCAVGYAEDPELRVTMTWPLDLTEGFLSLLRSREPCAVRVLLIYCVLMETAGSGNWYMAGWGRSVKASLGDADSMCS